MCTVSHCLAPHRLLVTMNRDERRTRAPECPPRLHDGTCCWLGPTDGEAGGSWIGVNDHGTVACLLNGYPSVDSVSPAAAARSRGGIVPQLMARGEAGSALDWLLKSFDPTPYHPFKVLVYSPNRGEVLVWDGRGRVTRQELFPSGWGVVTSSSWRQEEVIRWRQKKFSEWAKAPRFSGQLPTFNLLRVEGREWWSPLVSRDLSATRSISQVEVVDEQDGGWIEIRYWPRPFEPATQPDIHLRIPFSGIGASQPRNGQPGAVSVP